MDNQDPRRTHTLAPGQESHGVHACHKCGWPFPNPHPSAKHRRAHKRICGTIEGYKLSDSGGQAHLNTSDDEHFSDDDHKPPMSGPNALETGSSKKGNGGRGEKLNKSEDEVFSDAVADFSDSGLSLGIEEHLRKGMDLATNVERVDRNYPKFQEPSEVTSFNDVTESQLTVMSSDECPMQHPKVLQSEGFEAGNTLVLQDQPSGSTMDLLSCLITGLRTNEPAVAHSDDCTDLCSDSYPNKAEVLSDVSLVNKMHDGENVNDCILTSIAKDINLKGKDEIESDRDMAEIVVYSNDIVGELFDGVTKVEVSGMSISDCKLADGAVELKENNSFEFPSVLPRDDLSLVENSAVSPSDSTNAVRVESAPVLQFATTSDLVKQKRGEENVNVYTLSKSGDINDVAHCRSEFEDIKDNEGVVLQDTISLYSPEAAKLEKDGFKETVAEEYHPNDNSSELIEEKVVVSPDIHVLDDSIELEQANCEPMVKEMLAEEQAEVYPINLTVVDYQRLDDIEANRDSMKSEMNESDMPHFFGEPESDDVYKISQQMNSQECSVVVSFEKFEDCIDHEGVLSQTPLTLSSSKTLKLEEDFLKDTVSEESHSISCPSQLYEESEVLSLDIHALDNRINQELVNSELMVEEMHSEERAEVSKVKLTIEDNQLPDEVGSSVNVIKTEMDENHMVHLSGEQESDDICKNSQQISLPEGSFMGSLKENPRDASICSATSQTTCVPNTGDISRLGNDRTEIEGLTVEGKCRVSNGKNDDGNIMKTHPSDHLEMEVKPSSDVSKSDDVGEGGKIEKCDISDTQCREGPIVRDMLLPKSANSHFVTNGSDRKSTGVEYINVDVLLGTKEALKEDEFNSNSQLQEESNRFVSTFTNLHQTRDVELLVKALEDHVRKDSSLSPLYAEDSDQHVSAAEDKQAGKPGGEVPGISALPVQDQSGHNSVKQQLGSSRIDTSVDSASQCDSLEGNWGSVSVLSIQSDAPHVTDAEALPSTNLLESSKAERSSLDTPKPMSVGQHSEKSEMFEPPSFMTLIEPGHLVGPNAASSNVPKGQNPQPQQPNSSSSQAGWFPTLTQVVNESQGRKKNEEIIAKVTNWSTSKEYTPLKSLLGEAAHSNKPKSPKLEENPVNHKNGKVPKDNDSGLTTVNSILGPESPAALAVKGVAGEEWNSPARFPADMKREKRKVKSRPYWIQFVCCSSVDPQRR